MKISANGLRLKMRISPGKLFISSISCSMLHPKRIYLSMSVCPTYNYKLLIAYSATFVLDGVIIEYITRYDSSSGFHIFYQLQH